MERLAPFKRKRGKIYAKEFEADKVALTSTPHYLENGIHQVKSNI